MKHTPRIYLSYALNTGQELELPSDKAHHLATVLRAKQGDELIFFNGDGFEYSARLCHVDRKSVAAYIEKQLEPKRESNLNITLVQGIARGDRMDFALAKAVELGVNRIIPVFTQRSKIKLKGSRLEKKYQHWQKITESAAQQSGRLICPKVESAITLKQFFSTPKACPLLLLAPQAKKSLRDIKHSQHITVIIGPESGLSEQEIALALHNGAQAIQMGPRILRTETAGVASLTALQCLWGDLA